MFTPSTLKNFFAERGWVVEAIDQNGDGHLRVWVSGTCNAQAIRDALSPIVRMVHVARINDRWSIAVVP